MKFHFAFRTPHSALLMVDRREIITLCRQIGNMMDAGVDILRATQVLRAQTDNTRLLKFYNQFDHDLRMGASIAEAMSRASDVFSPFMVTLVRQAEQRSDLETISKHVAAAFLKIAEFLQQDEDTQNANDAAVVAAPPGISAFSETPETWPLTLHAIENFTDKLQLIALRALTLTAGLLLSLAAVWWSVEMEWLERRWLNIVLCSVSALFIGCAGIWVRLQIEKEHRQAQRCSFCSREESEELVLRPVPGFAGAAICANCAMLLAQRSTAETEGAAAAPAAAPAPTAVAKTKSAAKTFDAAAPTARHEIAPAAASARPGRVKSAASDEVSYE